MKLSREQRNVIKEITRIRHTHWSSIAVHFNQQEWPIELVTLKPKWWKDGNCFDETDEYRANKKKFMSPILFYLKRSISPREFNRVEYMKILGYNIDEFKQKWEKEKYSYCKYYYEELFKESISNSLLLKDFPELIYNIADN